MAPSAVRFAEIAVIQSPASPTLDALFRRVCTRHPEALALLDPLDCTRVTGRTPQRFTYAQADRAIAALAAHFAESGLPAQSVLAVQLPNTSRVALTVLAAHRAGLVVALIPQLWRQAELTIALNRIGARGIVTSASIDGVNHADLALNAAAEAFSIRYVGGFGDALPEGMAPLDAVIAAGEAPAGAPDPAPQDARRPALITFDTDASGLRVVPRSHVNLIAGGLAIYLESGLPQGATVMSALAPSSFAGVAASLVPWLLTGGALALHHPFDAAVLEKHLVLQSCAAVIAPAPLLMRLAEAGTLARIPALRQVIGLWRTPEQVAGSDPWTASPDFTDVYLFGEAGLFGARRDRTGAPQPILPGPHGAPRGGRASSIAGDTFITDRGTLALRGPMVAAAAYAADSAAAADHIDTGYAARLNADGAIVLTAPPAGLFGVGGYRFRAEDLGEWAKRLGQSALLTALPDRVSGHRLAGRAQDNGRARAALAELGLNPLMVDAFRDRGAG